MTESSSRPDLSRLKIDRSRKRREGIPSWLLKLVLAGAVAAGAWYAWQLRSEPDEPAEPQASTPRLITASYAVGARAAGISGNGYVIARRRAALSTVLSGRLMEIHVEEGSRVVENQVVARIQYDDYENALDEAEANRDAAKSRRAETEGRRAASLARIAQLETAVEVAEKRNEATRTDLDKARRDLERNRKSYLEKDVSEARWDELETAVERTLKLLAIGRSELANARKSVDVERASLRTVERELETQDFALAQAEKQVSAARIQLEKTFVRAPFAGVIVDKGAEQGEVVAATGAGGNSRGSVATLVDLDTLEVQVELPETRLTDLAEGRLADIYLDVEKERAWPGKIRQIWPTADRGKGTVEIRIVFVERPATLRPEMGARVEFLGSDATNERKPKKIGLPVDCVLGTGDDAHVFVVRNGKVERRGIAIESREGNRVIIASGIEPGEKVIARPPAGIEDGDSF